MVYYYMVWVLGSVKHCKQIGVLQEVFSKYTTHITYIYMSIR